jgi:heme oxygenase
MSSDADTGTVLLICAVIDMRLNLTGLPYPLYAAVRRYAQKLTGRKALWSVAFRESADLTRNKKFGKDRQLWEHSNWRHSIGGLHYRQ